MKRRIFVGGLPYSCTDSQLSAAFEPVGEVVSASVIIDRDSGNSRGFGFVEFLDSESVQIAIETVHGQLIEGRACNVREAHDRPPPQQDAAPRRTPRRDYQTDEPEVIEVESGSRRTKPARRRRDREQV